jgi:hypothetical protein
MPRTISITSSSIGMPLSSWTATPGMASTICCSSAVQGRPLSSFCSTLGGTVTAPSWLAIAATSISQSESSCIVWHSSATRVRIRPARANAIGLASSRTPNSACRLVLSVLSSSCRSAVDRPCTSTASWTVLRSSAVATGLDR